MNINWWILWIQYNIDEILFPHIWKTMLSHMDHTMLSHTSGNIFRKRFRNVFGKVSRRVGFGEVCGMTENVSGIVFGKVVQKKVPPLKSVWPTFGQYMNICVFCHACLQIKFLMISGSESRRLELQNHAFRVRCVAKTNFRAEWNSVDFSVICLFISGALESQEIRWLSMAFGGGPKLRAHGQFVVIWFVPGPHCNDQTVWSSSSTCKIQLQLCRNTRIRKTTMQITKIRKIKAAIWFH